MKVTSYYNKWIEDAKQEIQGGVGNLAEIKEN